MTVRVALRVIPLYVPEIFAFVFLETLLVVTVKETLLAPAGMVADEGTCAIWLPLLNEITAPVGGAAPFRVNVPVEEDLPVTLLGESTSDDNAAGVTVRVAVLLTPNVAVTVTEVEVATPLVVIVKVAVRFPPVTVTLDGVVADVLLSDKVTTVPPEGAGPLNVTVPVDELPPTTLVGLIVTELNVDGLIVKPAWTLAPL